MNEIFDLIPTSPSPVENKTVVRLTTSTWSDGSGVFLKKSLKYLKRQCIGYNALSEDDSPYPLDHIVNFAECKDGVYEVIVVNVAHDFETGIADDWDYKLIPLAAEIGRMK